jgi:hypothetical protein
LVALASVGLQRGSVEDDDHAAAVRDPAFDLQPVRSQRDAFAPNPDHVGDELLSHAQHTIIDPIEAKQ